MSKNVHFTDLFHFQAISLRPRIVSKTVRQKSKLILCTIIRNSISKKMWKGVLLVDFTICLKLRCLLLILLIAMHNRYLILSIIEVPYDKLTKYLNSGLTKLFFHFCNRARNRRKTKIKTLAKILFLLFLKLKMQIFPKNFLFPTT